MKCFLQGVAGFMVCGLLVSLFLPSIRAGGSYKSKELSIMVRVYDTDEHKPIEGAQVTFFKSGRETSLADADPHLSESPKSYVSSAVTDHDGYAEVTATFNAWASRGPAGLGGGDHWYRLGGGWLKVVAPGRPEGFVALNGHGFGGERDYENNEPLQVIVVLNKGPM